MGSVKSCAFTGHRPQSLPFGFRETDERCLRLKERIKQEVIKLIEEYGVTHFISGMALGVDTYSAEIVLALKKKYPNITLECAIPCENQCEKWEERDRDRYYHIAEQSDKETIVQRHYSADCMQKRNQYMVDHAEFLIAIWNGTPSGTGKTVQYAKAQNKTIIQIDPTMI